MTTVLVPPCRLSRRVGQSFAHEDGEEQPVRDSLAAMKGGPFELEVVKNAMKVEPLGDKVVVRRLEPEETTSGGIVLPDAARERPQQGRVLSVGDGRQLRDGSRAPHQVKEGDRVVFASYAGTEVQVSDEELLIMSEDEILAILD